MPRETLIQNAFAEWCAGFPLVGYRPLSPDEQRRLRRQTSTHGWRVLAGLLSGPGLVTFCLRMGVSPGRWDILGNVLYLGLFIGIILCFPSTALIAHSLKRYRQGLAELRLGFVRRFEGESFVRVPGDPTQELLVARHLLAVEAHSSQSIEVLSGSSRVWNVNGELPPGEIEAVTTRTARAPVAIPPPAATSESCAASVAPALIERPFSEEERKELRRHVRRCLLRYLGQTVISSPLFLLVLWLTCRNPPTPSLGLAFVITVLGTWAIAANVLFFRNVVAVRALSADLRRGIVEIYMVQRSSRVRGSVEHPDSGTEESTWTQFELLPVSRWRWSINLEPVPWRRSAA